MRDLASMTLGLSLLVGITRPARADEPPETLLERAGDLTLHASFDEAAASLERFADVAKADPRAPRALFGAMTTRIALGQIAEAKKDLAALEGTFFTTNPEIWAEGVFALHAHFERRGETRACRDLLGAMLATLEKTSRKGATKDPGTITLLREIELRARVRLARALSAEGDTRGAAAEHGRARVIYPKLGVWPAKGKTTEKPHSEDTLDAIAETLFVFAEQKRAEAERTALEPYKGKGDRETVLAYLTGPVEKWFVKRREAIEEAERAYIRLFGVEWQKPPPPPPASAFGGDPVVPWMASEEDPLLSDDKGLPPPSPRFAIAAARQIGASYAEMSHTIRVLPVPAVWNRSDFVREIRLSRMVIYDSPSDTMEYRAKQAFEACLRLSVLHRIVDEHTRACEVWLAKHRRAEYFTLDELLLPPGWTSVGVDSMPAVVTFVKR